MKLKDLIRNYGECEVSGDLISRLNELMRKTVWKLKDGEECFLVRKDGEIDDVYFDIINGRCIYKNEREIGNIFLTKEDALKDIERRRVEELLLRYGGKRGHFEKSGGNWHLYYRPSTESLRIDSYGEEYISQGTILFDTREEIENAIEAIGEERIKKALFNVE